MSKSDAFEQDVALLVFNGISIEGLADVGVADPLNDLWLSLHTAALGETSTQTDNEAAYSGYTRVAVPRDSAYWDVVDGVASNAALVQFPVAAADGIPIVALAIGTAETGPGKILHYGALSSPLSIYTGVQPEFDVGDIQAGEI